MEEMLQEESDEEMLQGGARMRSPERSRPRPSMSQKDYAPTPYEDTVWEIVGEPLLDRSFNSMKLEVFRDDELDPDPMFENFDDRRVIGAGISEFKTPGADPEPEVVAAGPAEQVFDPELLEAERAKAYEEGYAAGVAEGRGEAEQIIVERYEQLREQMTAVSKQIAAQVSETLDEIERRALALSLEIARKIVTTTVEIKPDYIVDIIRRAMGSLGAAKALRVRISPDDYEFLDVVGLPSEMGSGEMSLEYVADESIKAGCVVETSFGEVSMELDEMWQEIKDKLLPPEE